MDEFFVATVHVNRQHLITLHCFLEMKSLMQKIRSKYLLLVFTLFFCLTLMTYG